MTRPDPEPSPQEEERVRRLLADARHEAPLPEDVADRLDRVLARLAEEPSEVTSTKAAPSLVGLSGADIDVARRRRRRRATSLLAAAAAVAVVGFGVARVVTGGGGASTGSADSAAGGGGVADSPAPASKSRSTPGPTASKNSADGSRVRNHIRVQGYALAGVPRLRSTDFSADVTRVLRHRRRLAADSLTFKQLSRQSDQADARQEPFTCRPASWGPGRLFPVTYDGAPAVLVERPSAGETRVVDLLQCGTATVLRSITLPVTGLRH